MKQYTHDYTKVSEAESHLYAAQQLNAHEDPVEAWKHVQDARRLLQEYLSQDNMVEDDDVEDGWVRASEAGAYRYRPPVDPATTAVGQRVEKHKGIDSRFLRLQTEGADASNPLYGRTVVMSGTFEQIGMERDQVAGAIQRLGAKLNRGIGPTVNVFVTGNKPGPSKLREVEAMRASGSDIRIVSQLELKEIIEEYLPAEG